MPVRVGVRKCSSPLTGSYLVTGLGVGSELDAPAGAAYVPANRSTTRRFGAKNLVADIRQQTPDDALRSVINRNGQGFQYRVLSECLAPRPPGEIPHTRWNFITDEYPVELNGKPTHVDFILAAGTHLLVAECKRVRGHYWGFARASQSLAATSKPVADFMHWSNDPTRILHRRTCEFGAPTHKPFHVALETKAHAPNNNDKEPPKTPKSLDQAIEQVLLARGGVMEDLKTREILRYGGGAIVPVVFTNTTLLVTDNDLADTDLATGNVSEATRAHSVDWLWCNCNLSRALRPSIPREPTERDRSPTKTTGLRRTLQMDVTRSVAIVRPSGIRDFLKVLSIDLEHDVDALP